jgi:hypothetical protein
MKKPRYAGFFFERRLADKRKRAVSSVSDTALFFMRLLSAFYEERHQKSAGYNVLSLWAFLALCHSELDLLAFCQSLEACVLNCAVVNEYVRAIGLGNKAEAF